MGYRGPGKEGSAFWSANQYHCQYYCKTICMCRDSDTKSTEVFTPRACIDSGPHNSHEHSLAQIFFKESLKNHGFLQSLLYIIHTLWSGSCMPSSLWTPSSALTSSLTISGPDRISLGKGEAFATRAWRKNIQRGKSTTHPTSLHT